MYVYMYILLHHGLTKEQQFVFFAIVSLPSLYLSLDIFTDTEGGPRLWVHTAGEGVHVFVCVVRGERETIKASRTEKQADSPRPYKSLYSSSGKECGRRRERRPRP